MYFDIRTDFSFFIEIALVIGMSFLDAHRRSISLLD